MYIGIAFRSAVSVTCFILCLKNDYILLIVEKVYMYSTCNTLESVIFCVIFCVFLKSCVSLGTRKCGLKIFCVYVDNLCIISFKLLPLVLSNRKIYENSWPMKKNVYSTWIIFITSSLSVFRYPCFENPYPMDIHESPVTACQYFADCHTDLIPALYSVGSSKHKRTGFSEKVWKIIVS